jgi:hypothetical protein
MESDYLKRTLKQRTYKNSLSGERLWDFVYAHQVRRFGDSVI